MQRLKSGIRSQRGKTAFLLSVTASVIISASVSPSAVEAQNGYRVFGTGGVGVGIRLGSPSGTKVTGPPEGASDFTLQCQTTGPSAGGSVIWDQIVWRGTTGYVPDAYILTGYNGFDPRIPRCGSAPAPTPPAPTSRAERAAAWAEGQIGDSNPGSVENPNDPSRWSGYCETFAEVAWATTPGVARTRTFTYSSAQAHANAVASRLRQGVPPRGAIVLYSNSSGYGHAAISVGNGQVVSTNGWWWEDKPNFRTSYTSFSGYRGWYMP